jgi:hypothetical protein
MTPSITHTGVGSVTDFFERIEELKTKIIKENKTKNIKKAVIVGLIFKPSSRDVIKGTN